MAESFKLYATPNPNELILGVDVPVIKIKPDMLVSLPGKLLSEFTDFEVSRAISDFGNYRFLKWNLEQTSGHVTALFGQPKSNDLDHTLIPEPFETYYETVDYTWPAVLGGLYTAKDSLIPVDYGANTRDRLFVRPIVKQRQTLQSKVKIERFVSNIPLPESFTEFVQPQPTEISWNYTGVEPYSLLCLHDDVRLSFSDEKRVDSLMSNPRVDYKEERFFPATNMLDWQDFVLRVAHAENLGLHYYERHTIIPPFAQFNYA